MALSGVADHSTGYVLVLLALIAVGYYSLEGLKDIFCVC